MTFGLSPARPYPVPCYSGADGPNRTDDRVITSDLLCQLSYVGLCGLGKSHWNRAAVVRFRSIFFFARCSALSICFTSRPRVRAMS